MLHFTLYDRDRKEGRLVGINPQYVASVVDESRNFYGELVQVAIITLASGREHVVLDNGAVSVSKQISISQEHSL